MIDLKHTIKANSYKCVLAGITLMLSLTAYAMTTTEVVFEKGNSCGYYQGDLTAGQLFLIELQNNKQLIIKTDGHVQAVTDSSGKQLEDEGGINYLYQPQLSGTHTIKMVGRSNSSVDFCIRTPNE